MMNGTRSVGISAQSCRPDLSDLAATIESAVALGVETVELPTYDYDIVVGGRVRRDQLDRAKAATAGRGVTYTVHGPLAINFFAEPWRCPRHFDVLKASLEVAAELKAVNYVVHSGLIAALQRDGLADAYARQREWLARAGDVARGLNLVLCVENLFGGYEGKVHAVTPARLARELAAIGHPHVKATLDFSHAYLALTYSGGDLVAECAALAPFASHLHVHDSFGRQDDIWMFTNGERLAYGHGDLHLPVGWGDIPWADIVAACEFPHGVVVNIELNGRYWHVAQDCVDATRAAFAGMRTAPAR